jgi:hypothetical protein
MKVIFSRKGFDSAAGGVPSPIVDGRPVSLPIPTKMPSPLRFVDLAGNLPGLVADLSGGRVDAAQTCHLDPDIDSMLIPRMAGWRGALGQDGAAQGHLTKQRIQPGDLFLFWGLFRPVETHAGKWRYVGTPEHRIFGWLHVAEVVALGPDGSHALQRFPWLDQHPHVRPGWGASNTLYVASNGFSIESRAVPGFGTFRQGRRLTRVGSPRPSEWSTPAWLNPRTGGTGMSYNPPSRWASDGVRTASRGQEFVADIGDRADATAWLVDLLSEVE